MSTPTEEWLDGYRTALAEATTRLHLEGRLRSPLPALAVAESPNDDEESTDEQPKRQPRKRRDRGAATAQPSDAGAAAGSAGGDAPGEA